MLFKCVTCALFTSDGMTSFERCHSGAIRKGVLCRPEETGVKIRHWELSQVVKSRSDPNIAQVAQGPAKIKKKIGTGAAKVGALAVRISRWDRSMGLTENVVFWCHIRSDIYILTWHNLKHEECGDVDQQALADKRAVCCGKKADRIDLQRFQVTC